MFSSRNTENMLMTIPGRGFQDKSDKINLVGFLRQENHRGIGYWLALLFSESPKVHMTFKRMLLLLVTFTSAYSLCIPFRNDAT